MDRRGVVFWLSSGHRRHQQPGGSSDGGQARTSASTAAAAVAAAAAAAAASKAGSSSSSRGSPRLEKMPSKLEEEDEEGEDDVAELVRVSRVDVFQCGVCSIISFHQIDFGEKSSSGTSSSAADSTDPPTPAQKRATRLKRAQSDVTGPSPNLRLPQQQEGKKKPPPISPRKHEREGTSPPTAPPSQHSKAAPQPVSKAAAAQGQVPDSFSDEVQKRIKAKRANLVHSMTFTAKDLDPTTRFMTGREKTHSQARRCFSFGLIELEGVGNDSDTLTLGIKEERGSVGPLPKRALLPDRLPHGVETRKSLLNPTRTV